MDKAASVFLHLLKITSVPDLFWKKSTDIFVSTAKLHHNYKKHIIIFIMKTMCELKKTTHISLHCFVVCIYNKHYWLYNFSLHELYDLFELY